MLTLDLLDLRNQQSRACPGNFSLSPAFAACPAGGLLGLLANFWAKYNRALLDTRGLVWMYFA